MAEWDRILLREEYSPEKPDEIVTRLTFVLEEREARRVLDLGCGAGRHVTYLTKQGFETYGADISGTGLKLTKKKLRTRKLKAEIIKCDMKSMPFSDSSFEAVICIRTIYHQKLREIQETISEIHRVLKHKGLFIANFHTRKSGKYGKGMRVEEGTFLKNEGPEKGVLHHFVDEDELCELLKSFEVIHLEAKEKLLGNYLESRFNILTEKI